MSRTSKSAVPRAGHCVAGAMLSVLLLSCGGGTVMTQPVSLTFHMGGEQLRQALVARFPHTLTPESTTWPEDAPPLDVELHVVQRAEVDLTDGKASFSGKPLRFGAAVVRAEGPTGLDRVDLLVGPARASGPESAGVFAVAYGPLPPALEVRALVWTEEGPRLLEAALEGRLPEQEGRAELLVFLRGRAVVGVRPGEPLPEGEPGRVVLDVPIVFDQP